MYKSRALVSLMTSGMNARILPHSGRPYCADGPNGLQSQPLWPVAAVERRHGPKETEFREGFGTNLLVEVDADWTQTLAFYHFWARAGRSRVCGGLNARG